MLNWLYECIDAMREKLNHKKYKNIGSLYFFFATALAFLVPLCYIFFDLPLPICVTLVILAVRYYLFSESNEYTDYWIKLFGGGFFYGLYWWADRREDLFLFCFWSGILWCTFDLLIGLLAYFLKKK